MRFYEKVRRILFVTFFTAIVVSLILYFASGQELTAGQIKTFASNLGIWLPLSFIIFYVVVSIFSPTTPLMALAGLLFGFWYGFLYTTIAGLISAMFVFYLSRYLGKDWVDDFINAKSFKLIEKYNDKMTKHAIWTIILLRMMPIMPFPILNFLLGVSKVNAKNYALGTFIGLIPSHILTVYFGILIINIIL